MNRLAYLILFCGILASAHGQLEVGVESKRHMFMVGEPVEITVTIRNLAGKDIILRDNEGHRWFGFEVIKGKDRPIAPIGGGYKNDPLVVLAGDVVRRRVDLGKLFSLTELGTYNVRPAIYFADTGKYYSAEPVRLDVSDGRKIWTQTVGVPSRKEGAGQYRVFSLLSFQQPKELTLYARVEEESTGDILGTYPLGRLIAGTAPTKEFDKDNALHVLQMVGPSQYYLSKIGVNGEWLGQSSWNAAKGRATVRKKADGAMVVVGATRERTETTAGPPVPKLSDRPVGLPR